MSMKILMSITNSPWFKKRHLDSLESLEKEIFDMKRVLMTSSRDVCPDYNSNFEKLKDSIRKLDKISENPLSGFVCTREDAKAAYLQYADESVSQYYILQNMRCSTANVDFHLKNLLRVFEIEGNEYRGRFILEDEASAL